MPFLPYIWPCLAFPRRTVVDDGPPAAPILTHLSVFDQIDSDGFRDLTSTAIYPVAMRDGDLGEPELSRHDRVELHPVGEPVMARPGGAQVEICLGLGEGVITIRAEGGDVTTNRSPSPMRRGPRMSGEAIGGEDLTLRSPD
jgi:hypothetical protein